MCQKAKKCLANSNVDGGNCFSQNGYCSDLIRVIAQIVLPNDSLSVYNCVCVVSFCALQCLNKIRRTKQLGAIIHLHVLYLIIHYTYQIQYQII